MRSTQRSLTNIPTNLEALTRLSDLDLSRNGLTKIPDGLFTLPSLKRLNLSENQLKEISTAIGKSYNLQPITQLISKHIKIHCNLFKYK